MNEKLSIYELKVLYNELLPVFRSGIEQPKVEPVIVINQDTVNRKIAQQIRNQQDEEDKNKIRRSLW